MVKKFKMLPYSPIWSKKVQNCPKLSKTFPNSPRLYKTVQNSQKGSKWSNLWKQSNIVQYCPKRFKMVQKSFKWSTNFPKWSNKVEIHLKLFQTTAVGVTAVGVTAVRNYLKFLTIRNIGSTIILWWSLFVSVNSFQSKLPNSRLPKVKPLIEKILSGSISEDSLRTFWDFPKLFWALSEDLLRQFWAGSEDFQRTFQGLSEGFLGTFWWLSEHFLRTFSGLFREFLRTFCWVLKNFWFVSKGPPWTFWGLSKVFLRTFWQISQDFLRT